MKRFLIVILVLSVIVLAVACSIKPLVIGIARKQLSGIFIKSRVSIGGCVKRPKQGLALLNAEIEKEGVYKITLEEAGIELNFFSLAQRKPLKFFLKGAKVKVNAPKKKASELSGYFNLPGGGPSIFGHIEVSDLGLDLKTQDLALKAVAFFDMDLVSRSVDFLDLRLKDFSMSGALLQNGSFSFGLVPGEGKFSIEKAKYNKLRVAGINGKIRFKNKTLSFYDILAKTLGGELRGEINLKLGERLDYQLKLNCASLDTAGFVRDFELSDKFEMTGKLNGWINLEGQNVSIRALSGDFSVLSPGGSLTIKDTKMLENMAQSTKQPLDLYFRGQKPSPFGERMELGRSSIPPGGTPEGYSPAGDLLVESFKDYHYNTGVVRLGLSDRNVILKINLEGEAGRRELEVVAHGLF
ncbi:MAG: hypothetical protein KJ880_04500 [Candidatus Omnitrophica bacterium]|nr:hypothetical protein [Candidatus Omnitrophota bacterium]MBU1869479.1 hypothetical protein [Candidatus Omnitrophota bacterium]